MRNSGVDHFDLVVSDLERSLQFYRGLLEPLGKKNVQKLIDGLQAALR